MRRRIPLTALLGIDLILCGLCVMLVFQLQIHRGTRISRDLVTQLEACLPEKTPGIPDMDPNTGMPVLELDGTDYAALLDVPAFGIRLPVADEWEGRNLTCCPARFFGSAYDGTLVIGGGDYPGQFSFCPQIGHGASVTVTDMTGACFSYTVARIDQAQHAESQWLTEQNWDLTLFCRDSGTMEYIAVRCVLTGH